MKEPTPLVMFGGIMNASRYTVILEKFNGLLPEIFQRIVVYKKTTIQNIRVNLFGHFSVITMENSKALT